MTRPAEAIFDTSVVVDMTSHDPASLAVAAAVSVITLAELQFGVLRTEDPDERAARVANLGAVAALFEPVPVDRQVASAYASLADETVRAGRQPRRRAFDLLIAATAQAREVPMFTRNPDDLAHLASVDVRPVA